MPQLIVVHSGRIVGEITREQIELLFKHLAADRHGDNDLYINRATLEHLNDVGVDADTIGLLAAALDDRDDVDVTWVEGAVGPHFRGPFR